LRHFELKNLDDVLYPKIEAYRTGRLPVSNIHDIYYEECGNPDGKPVVFLHGGPGGGIVPSYRQYFNPEKYRVVLFDQRGAGKSTPHACLDENTTWDLVSDIEKIREELGIEKWQVFGGSWGSTLALSYAETHPNRVTELVLRGIFLLRDKELKWFYQEGAGKIFPEAWDKFLEPIAKENRGDLLGAYHEILTGDDRELQLRAAKAWSTWEGSTSQLVPNPQTVQTFGEDEFATAFARIESHYFKNKGFLRNENQLLDDIGKIRNIPGVIVQGRYDVVCPAQSAWELHQAWPESELFIENVSGHSMVEPQIAARLVEATDKFAN